MPPISLYLDSPVVNYTYWIYFERHTPVYIWSHSRQCISEQKPNHEVKGAACIAQRLEIVLETELVLRHRPEEVYKTFCCIEGCQDNSGLHNSYNGRCLEQPGLFLELAAWQN